MKVAIIGAGLSGLSCAIELEKHGIIPTVYERNSFIGEQHSHVGATLEIITRPLRDPVEYFAKEFGIQLKPLNTVNTIVHNSPHKKTTINGNFGYFFNRSREDDDIKRQLYGQLKRAKVIFNEAADFRLLAREYDNVVIATGNSLFTEELGCWNQLLQTYVRGAIINGDFDPNTLGVWIDKKYCNDGYAYLTPFNAKKASAVLVVTDVSEKEVDHYWELFLYTEKITGNIIEEFKLQHKAGHVYPHKTGKIYFVGNAGGVIDPFLGFGIIAAIQMGIFAARSIAQGKDYEKLMEDTNKHNLRLYEFRKALNASSNFGYDILMTSIGLPGLKQLVYDTPLNVVKIGAFFLRMLSKLK